MLRALLLNVMALSFCVCVNADEPAWYGTMDTGVREFRFVISPDSDNKEQKIWQLRSLEEGDAVFVLDNFQLDDKSLSFALKNTKASYAGARSVDGDEIQGHWQQNGGKFDLTLRRMEAAPEDEPAEIWTGELSTLFQQLVVQFRVYAKGDQREHILFDSVSQKAGGFKASRTIDAGKWTVQVPAVGGTFTGMLSADGTKVSGKWMQGGNALELELKKTASAVRDVPEQKRPQTPQPPFPYDAEEITFASVEDGVMLAGTLTIPKGAVPQGGFPAAVLISGSGPQDRDESLLDHKPFAVLADALSRNGIAVLRYDDRGTGTSTGNFASGTSLNFAEDARGALQALRKDGRIHHGQTGLIGHSEGGLIAPLVAEGNSDVAWIVLLAGPSVNGAEILRSQARLILKAEGVTDETALKAQQKSQEVMFELINSHPAETPLALIVDAAVQKLSDVLPEDEAERKQFRIQIEAGLKNLNTPWFRWFLAYDPRPTLEKIRCPVLALNGELDLQVDPDLNLPVMTEALKIAGNPWSEAEELPGLNHLFQSCETGAVSEYQLNEETMSPLVLDRIVTWIHKVTGTGNKRVPIQM